MKRLTAIMVAIAAAFSIGVTGAWAIPSSYQAVVSEGNPYVTPYVTLGSQYIFDYWFEMAVAPPPYQGQAFDALSVNEDGSWVYLGGVYAYTSSSNWASATLNVPIALQGKSTRIIFQVSDFGPDTNPSVYLNNVPGVAVPEPSTMLLLGLGLIGLAGVRRCR